jgi:hypothetical protein
MRLRAAISRPRPGVCQIDSAVATAVDFFCVQRFWRKQGITLNFAQIFGFWVEAPAFMAGVSVSGKI